MLLNPVILSNVKGEVEKLSLQTRQARSNLSVALVSMPFVSTKFPSIQLGILSSIAKSHGFPVKCFNLNLDLAHRIGQELFESLSVHRGRLWAEWLFSVEAFGCDAPDQANNLLREVNYNELYFLFALLKDPRKKLPILRNETIPQYLDHLMESIPWQDYKVVGFSSTFQQNTSSFALARRIKEKHPHIITLFGGANFDGEMGLELVRSIDVIDYAVIGEGDQVFPEFLIALQEDRNPLEVPGVVGKENCHQPIKPRPLFRQMDQLPTPDYSDFFERRDTLTLADNKTWSEMPIPFESSRGCWWGEKHHCTFCGLNALGMNFRSKSVERVLEELSELSEKYGTFEFSAVDNIIEPRYLKDLFSKLNETTGMNYTFFYEVKANMSREQLRTLSIGGVRSIQPGIESLNSHVLELMKKGVKAIQNVNFLRWSQYYDIKAYWNILYGFPGETHEDYDQQVALIPQLAHLRPPITDGRIWMERFSPIYVDKESFPTDRIEPELSYHFVYPKYCDLDKIAYYFDYELENTLPDNAYRELKVAIEKWRNLWRQKSDNPPFLTYWHSPKCIRLLDGRQPEKVEEFVFPAIEADIYLLCSDKPQTSQSIHRNLPDKENISLIEIEQILSYFVDHGFMMQDGNLFLSLALPASQWR